MSFNHYLKHYSILLALGFGILRFTPSLQANVYATNIKANGSSTNALVGTGANVFISYILNEPASRVTVNILSGTTVVRSLTFNDDTNTLRGLNTITWDGKDTQSHNVAEGSYSVSITASSSGYTNWTQITSDLDDPFTFARGGQGIAVDQNPNSPFYGRVFVANAFLGPDPGNTPGDALGILKFNADATGADEGIASAGFDGRDWTGEGLSPWKVEVSADDHVYVSDVALGGEVLRWDPTVSSNSLVSVLRQDNRPNGATLVGPAIFGTGTNTQIWMADTNAIEGQSLGILQWTVTASGTCATNDTGETIVDLATNLTLGPSDVALDKFGNIYTCQSVSTPGDPSPRVFRFPAYNPATNSGLPELRPDWAVGTNDDTYAGASGIAVDPTGTYVAVAFQGLQDPTLTNGNTKILLAATGALVTNVDLGIDIDNIQDTTHQDTDCAWDALGNLYYIDNWVGHWRVVSPPGTNQATTLAPVIIQVTSSSVGGTEVPVSAITVSNGVVVLDFTGTASDVPSSFSVLGSAVASGPYSVMANASITLLSPGLFQARVSTNGAMQFYRVQRQGGPPPPQDFLITGIALSGGTVTINFTASATNLPSAFTLLSSTKAAGPYTNTTGAAITPVSSGVFQATAPANGPLQFYRLQK